MKVVEFFSREKVKKKFLEIILELIFFLSLTATILLFGYIFYNNGGPAALAVYTFASIALCVGSGISIKVFQKMGKL